MSMIKKPMTIEAGVRYAGYGTLNEFGEWVFTPSQVGSRQGQKKFVFGDKEFTVYSTKKKVIVHLTLDRDERLSMMGRLAKIVDKILITLKDYDFRRISVNNN